MTDEQSPGAREAPNASLPADAGPFHVMAKPAGAACNLACAYCFYTSKETLPGGPGAGEMDDETLELFVRRRIEAASGPEALFSWQGGEPTLRGLAFFRRAVALQRQYAKPGLRIENDLQTNGVLFDDDWARFLKEHRFLVGLSIDGPRKLHDRFRLNKGGAPTFDKVVAAARLLRRHGVDFSTLTCVHRFNAARALEVYRFLRDELGSTRIQFIPVVQRQGFETIAPQDWDPSLSPAFGSPEARPGRLGSVVTDWSVDPDAYGAFLSAVFDEWRRKDLGQILVTHFETLVAQRLGYPSQMCVYSETCGRALALEHDGGVYACDHYVYDGHRLGALTEASLSTLAFGAQQVEFGRAKSATLPRRCRECPFLADCWGECPKNRLIRAPDGEVGLNYLCAGLRKFFAHARPEIERIVTEIRRRRPEMARRAP